MSIRAKDAIFLAGYQTATTNAAMHVWCSAGGGDVEHGGDLRGFMVAPTCWMCGGEGTLGRRLASRSKCSRVERKRGAATFCAMLTDDRVDLQPQLRQLLVGNKRVLAQSLLRSLGGKSQTACGFGQKRVDG